jgi:hypothetical protein
MKKKEKKNQHTHKHIYIYSRRIHTGIYQQMYTYLQYLLDLSMSFTFLYQTNVYTRAH